MNYHMKKSSQRFAIGSRFSCAVIGYLCFMAFTLPVTYAGTLQQAYLKASNTSAGDYFGWALAIDGNTAVIGAREVGDDVTRTNNIQSTLSGNGTGAVYVFTRNGDSWSLQATLEASNAEPGDSFGHSVDISGDTLVVSGEHEDSSATGVNGNQSDNSVSNSGAVYVFVRSGTEWSQQAYIKASNTGVQDSFGGNVRISGDTLVVTAHPEDSNATGVNGDQTDNSLSSSGAVYVFTRTGTQWSQQAYLKASNTNNRDQFGHGVAISGDTIAVSAPREQSNATGINGDQTNNSGDRGAVYVFTRNGTSWSQQAYIKASNSDIGGEFGQSPGVSIDGDTLVVGARNEPSNATGIDGDQNNKSAPGAGAVYVFTRNGTTWSQQAYIKASNTDADDLFGFSVGVSGDSLVVGAWHEDSSAIGPNGEQNDNSSGDSGAAYLFTRNGTVWSQQDYLKASNTEANDNFGNVVGISDQHVVVAAIVEDSSALGVNGDQSDNSAENSGAAYVFDTNPIFKINAGLNDAWYNPLTDGQGFFVTVFPDIGRIFLSWFTYDTEFPAMNATANLGDPGHRWLTAFGSYADNQAVLNISITSGGLFDSEDAVQNVADGTIILTFEDCNTATVEYDIPSIKRQGIVPIQRIANDNIALCQALAAD